MSELSSVIVTMHAKQWASSFLMFNESRSWELAFLLNWYELGNGDKFEFDIEFDDRCWVRIFWSIDINRIPVCTLSIIEFDVELSSNSYDIVRILKKLR